MLRPNQVIGDKGVAELTMKVTDDKGEPVNVLSTENRLYEIGMGLYPQNLDEELAKLKTGDHKVIDVDLADSMNGSLLTRALDGNPEKLTFDVTVNAVKTKVLPELNEEFATEKAGFKSLEDMRNRTRDDMQHERQEYMDRMKENACLIELGKRLEGEAPEAMCNDERRTLLQGFFQQLQQQNITYDQYLRQRDLTNEQFQEDLKKQAKDVVSQNLAIDAYARHFNMEVTDEMVDKEFENSGNEDTEGPEGRVGQGRPHPPAASEHHARRGRGPHHGGGHRQHGDHEGAFRKELRRCRDRGCKGIREGRKARRGEGCRRFRFEEDHEDGVEQDEGCRAAR